MKKIAVINDLSGFGKCSLTAAIPMISAHGQQCCPLPTGVFSNQTGYDSFKSVDLTDALPGFIAEWKRLGARFDGILTGFIPHARQGAVIAQFIDDFKTEHTTVLVDPIMGDDGEVYPCYDGESIRAVQALAAKADIITPNVTELSLLCRGTAAQATVEEIEAMARSLGNPAVITTGIPLGDDIGNAVYADGTFRLITSRRRGHHFSGTGDIFSSYVLSEVVGGTDIFTAVAGASVFIERAIALTLERETAQHYHPDGIDFEALLDIK